MPKSINLKANLNPWFYNKIIFAGLISEWNIFTLPKSRTILTNDHNKYIIS